MSEVWVLEMQLDHEPGWIEGVYTSAERARAAAPEASWEPRDGDRRGWYQVVRPFDPMWTITPYPLDSP